MKALGLPMDCAELGEDFAQLNDLIINRFPGIGCYITAHLVREGIRATGLLDSIRSGDREAVNRIVDCAMVLSSSGRRLRKSKRAGAKHPSGDVVVPSGHLVSHGNLEAIPPIDLLPAPVPGVAVQTSPPDIASERDGPVSVTQSPQIPGPVPESIHFSASAPANSAANSGSRSPPSDTHNKLAKFKSRPLF